MIDFRDARCSVFFSERKLLFSSDLADLGGVARYTEIATEEAHRRSSEFNNSAPVAFKYINSHRIATLLSRYTVHTFFVMIGVIGETFNNPLDYNLLNTVLFIIDSHSRTISAYKIY